jgi:hypothetical protein
MESTGAQHAKDWYVISILSRYCGCNVRIVREILPELVTQLMSLLSSEEAEQQEVGQYVYFWITANNT